MILRASRTLLFVLVIPVALAGRFASSGPVLTITLKESVPPPPKGDDRKTHETGAPESPQPWHPFDVSSLRPSLVYSIGSRQPPLPHWLPALQSLRFGLGSSYSPQETPQHPSWIESTAKFDIRDLGAQFQIQPSHELHSGRTNLLLQASRGAHYVFAKISRVYDDDDATSTSTVSSSSSPMNNNARHSASTSKEPTTPTTTTTATTRLEAVKASALFRLPYRSLAAVRVTPALDFCGEAVLSCDVEAVTGGRGRTQAVLHCEYERPSLAVQYQPDPHNLIRPVIDLYSGKIVYQWILALRDGGSVNTRVDPDSAVTVQWTDPTAAGSWVTDVRVPLEKPLTANVRVRRQFQF